MWYCPTWVTLYKCSLLPTGPLIGIWNVNSCFQPLSFKKIVEYGVRDMANVLYAHFNFQDMVLNLLDYLMWVSAFRLKNILKKKNRTINLMTFFKYDTKKDFIRKIRWVGNSACGYKLLYAHVVWHLVI